MLLNFPPRGKPVKKQLRARLCCAPERDDVRAICGALLEIAHPNQAERDKLAHRNSGARARAFGPCRQGLADINVRLDAASSRRRRAAVAQSQRDDRKLLPLEFAHQGIDFATPRQCELRNMLLEQPLVGAGPG